MGVTLRKNEFAKKAGVNAGPRYTYGKRRVSGEGAFVGIIGALILLWWALKAVALVIFAMAVIAIVGALMNDNQPAGHDIAWAIIGFVALIVL